MHTEVGTEQNNTPPKLTPQTENTSGISERTTADRLQPTAPQTYVHHTPTKVTSGPHVHLTKLETRGREEAEQYST